MGTRLGRDRTLQLAEQLSTLASEFAHDANNLVQQLLGSHEKLNEELGTPLATDDELERITRYSRNVTTIARDLEALLERARPQL